MIRSLFVHLNNVLRIANLNKALISTFLVFIQITLSFNVKFAIKYLLINEIYKNIQGHTLKRNLISVNFVPDHLLLPLMFKIMKTDTLKISNNISAKSYIIGDSNVKIVIKHFTGEMNSENI